jgi:ribonucleoside-diphosphate reductase alpha chain
MDYLFRWLAVRFLDAEAHPAHKLARGGQLDLPKVPVLVGETREKAASDGPIVVEAAPARRTGFVAEADAPPCHECGTLMVRNGACHKCPNCGATSGCS